MRLLVAAIAMCALFVAAPLSAQRRVPPSSQPILVFVRGDAAKDGWTDPSGERGDSARDIIRHLGAAERKHVRPAAKESDATIVVEVLNRHKEFRTLVLKVRVSAGEFQTEMSSSSDVSLGSWRDCALKIVKGLDEWADANRARLIASH